MRELHFFEDDSPTLYKKQPSSNTGWAMSFADIVTVLLCFFIVFYMIEKKISKEIGFGNKDGAIISYSQNFESLEISSLIETVEKQNLASVYKTDKFIELRFAPSTFFASGGVKPTEEGKKLINSILPSLLDLKDKYVVRIQGYTDSNPVKRSAKRWWKSNMELSLLRSLNVYELLISKGINKKILSVTGFGNSFSKDAPRAEDRRINFRIEPRKYEE